MNSEGLNCLIAKLKDENKEVRFENCILTVLERKKVLDAVKIDYATYLKPFYSDCDVIFEDILGTVDLRN